MSSRQTSLLEQSHSAKAISSIRAPPAIVLFPVTSTLIEFLNKRFLTQFSDRHFVRPNLEAFTLSALNIHYYRTFRIEGQWNQVRHPFAIEPEIGTGNSHRKFDSRHHFPVLESDCGGAHPTRAVVNSGLTIRFVYIQGRKFH